MHKLHVTVSSSHNHLPWVPLVHVSFMHMVHSKWKWTRLCHMQHHITSAFSAFTAPQVLPCTHHRIHQIVSLLAITVYPLAITAITAIVSYIACACASASASACPMARVLGMITPLNLFMLSPHVQPPPVCDSAHEAQHNSPDGRLTLMPGTVPASPHVVTGCGTARTKGACGAWPCNVHDATTNDAAAAAAAEGTPHP